MGRADVYSEPETPDPVLRAELVWELVRPHLPDEVRLAGGMKVDESGGEARDRSALHRADHVEMRSVR